MLTATIETTGHAAEQARLRALVDAVDNRADMHQAMADGAKETVREHFRNLALSRNSSGGAGGRKAFYAIARDSTVARADGGGARVEVTGPRGIRQRLLGGAITADPGKYLAIPVDDKVKGIRAAEVYESLKLRAIVNQRTGKGVMYSQIETPKSPKPGEKVRVLYALTQEVTQAPDPSVLPTETEIATSAADAGADYLAKITRA